MPVSTNSTDMVRIVRRSGGPGYYVQHWDRSSTRTAWLCRRQVVRLTMRSALKTAKRWPGPLTVEPRFWRESSAR